VAQVGVTLAVVEVEPWVLPASAGTKVHGEPTAAANAGADAGEASKWVHDGTLSGTSGGTTGWSWHSLPLVCLLMGMDCIVCDDDIANKFWE
jgi:hypothetical protein